MNAPPHVCASCGEILAVAGGRCPMCGTAQPEATTPIKASARPAAPLAPASPALGGGAARLLQVGGAVALLAFLGLLAWKLYPRFAPPPPPARHPAATLPPPPIVVPSARVDPAMGAADLVRGRPRGGAGQDAGARASMESRRVARLPRRFAGDRRQGGREERRKRRRRLRQARRRWLAPGRARLRRALRRHGRQRRVRRRRRRKRPSRRDPSPNRTAHSIARGAR